MTKLFEPTQVGDIAVKNRIVMAPLTRNRSPGAIPNDLNVEYYRQRATAGLIITEATAITHQGQGYADVPGLYKKEALDGWKRVTDAVHAAGGKIVVQMWHVGRISHTTLQPNGGKPVSSTNKIANAKTYLVNADGTGTFADTSEPRALQTSEIPGIVEDYRKAARAAIDAGFDGVEIHGANGYLIDQFLRDGVNDRTDQYGGSIENRARFTFEVVDAVTREIGAGRTAIRISPVTPSGESYDSDPQALFTYVVEGLAKYDLAYVHIVEGADRRGPRLQAGRQTPPSTTRLCARLTKRPAARRTGWSTTATTATWRSMPLKAAAPTSSPSASRSSPIRIWWNACRRTCR